MSEGAGSYPAEVNIPTRTQSNGSDGFGIFRAFAESVLPETAGVENAVATTAERKPKRYARLRTRATLDYPRQQWTRRQSSNGPLKAVRRNVRNYRARSLLN